MKKLKVIITTILLFAFVIVQAQKVEYNGKNYMVKGTTIFIDKVDVTNTLSQEEQTNIKNRLSEQIVAKNKLNTATKAQRKAEKKQRKAEKKQKNAEKELKAKERVQKKYSDAQKKYKKELKRSEKLRGKGKLSPEDETKWQKKLESLKKKSEKLKSKL
ncbi:hypothetical protein R3X25_05720 [Lutibacter sp. TH_r2]|uniref:hypothetical protein n=1 Tax=Lutibacter sp. TH_r2 TaxID=3082083 RepID=UPI0029550D72|nr:hypothetical protein [Lutibacter sp. TH_r2]MDV7186774.1 hypothetical protein [Lutibacter sp. TH_r2]